MFNVEGKRLGANRVQRKFLAEEPFEVSTSEANRGDASRIVLDDGERKKGQFELWLDLHESARPG